jgi:hypothetical protein
MATRLPRIDRRVDEKIILVERRKGKLLMYGEIVFAVGLILLILWLLK